MRIAEIHANIQIWMLTGTDPAILKGEGPSIICQLHGSKAIVREVGYGKWGVGVEGCVHFHASKHLALLYMPFIEAIKHEGI